MIIDLLHHNFFREAAITNQNIVTMGIEHEDFQKARRISRAIQEYLKKSNQQGLRSTDIYPILARKNLIEKDRHNGLYFRKFLRKLKDNNVLKLIPQCQYQTNKTNYIEWYFYLANLQPKLNLKKQELNSSNPLISPKISENEINVLIKKTKPHITVLPKINPSKLNLQQLETRANYPRAYEIWTDREIEILKRAYLKFNRIDKVAELLERQPNVIRKKLMG